MSEQAVVNQCLELLYHVGAFAWRTNQGGVSAEYKGKRRFIRFNRVDGISDIIGVLPDGRFLGVECKYGRNTLTVDQEAFIERVRSKGGLTVVPYSVADLEAVLREEGYLR